MQHCTKCWKRYSIGSYFSS